MPNDTLREEIAASQRAAAAYITSNVQDPQQRRAHLQNLKSAQSRLSSEIEERSGDYRLRLDMEEKDAIEAKRSEIRTDPKLKRAFEVQKASHQQFEDLRRANGGGYPRNISPFIYIIPLILVGVAEWYVNFSTFASIFIPVFAIAATLIVAAVFAWASHLHGAYLKQISEIIHPSVEYRNVLGRKLAVYIATILLIAAFVTVIWLRWLVISEQLGANLGGSGGPFGDDSWSLIWSKVAPTIVINVLIWGLGTLYSWAVHEKVPGLRESYRDYLRATKCVDRLTQPVLNEERRLRAQFDREREKNNVALNEYKALLNDVTATYARIQESEAA
jgi:hypothetical protein